MRSILFTLLFVSSCISSQAQQEFEKYKKKYPKENGVVLSNTKTVTITLDKAGIPVINAKNHEQHLFLNDNYKYYMEESVNYSSFTKIESISPFVYIPNGDKYKKTKITRITDEDVYQRNVFHDDAKKKSFYYDGLQKGGKTELNYEEELTEPYFFGSFYFSSHLPVESSIYVIKTPLDMDILFTLFGDEKEKVKYTKEIQGKTIIHKWEGNNLTKLDSEASSVSVGYYATHIVARIGAYKHKNTDRHLIRDVKDLYSYYRGFINDINKEESADISKIADSLTSNLTNDDAKVEAIFQWVQDNIKYVAFEDGLGGFIPREASLVCTRKFGDCKDMASILYAMINSIGIPAYYTWIGSRSIRYDYTEVPTTATDNHMICSYHNGEKYIFLDATSKGLPLGMPSGFTQGKQALIGIDQDHYEVARVPIVESQDNGLYDTAYVHINDGIVIGEAKATYFGYPSIRLTDYMQNMSDEQKEDFYKNAFKKGNNKCKSEVTEERGLTNRGGPLELDYKFSIPDYINIYENELYINPFIKKYYAKAQINTETNSISKEVDYKDVTSNVVYIDFPEGYELTYLPESSSFSHEDFSFDITFKLDEEKKQIQIVSMVDVDHIVLKAEFFEAWNTMVKKLNKAYSEVITFKKIDNE